MRELVIIRRNGDKHTVLLDDEDYDRVVAAGPWRVVQDGRTFYAVRTLGTRRSGLRTSQRLHRFLLGAACEDKQVDHIDGNGLNNQRANLRPCTSSENGRNRRIGCNSTSGLKGVYWHRRGRRWCAKIKLNGKHHHLGSFDTAEEAYAAYCEAAEQMHGEFARLK